MRRQIIPGWRADHGKQCHFWMARRLRQRKSCLGDQQIPGRPADRRTGVTSGLCPRSGVRTGAQTKRSDRRTGLASRPVFRSGVQSDGASISKRQPRVLTMTDVACRATSPVPGAHPPTDAWVFPDRHGHIGRGLDPTKLVATSCAA